MKTKIPEMKVQRYKRLGRFGDLALSLLNAIDADPGVPYTKIYPEEGLSSTSTVFARYIDFLEVAKMKLPNHNTFF